MPFFYGTPPHEELNEEDMSAKEISYKYKQWCKRNHPDKQKDDMEEENKEAATALIKEFGLILQKPYFSILGISNVKFYIRFLGTK